MSQCSRRYQARSIGGLPPPPPRFSQIIENTIEIEVLWTTPPPPFPCLSRFSYVSLDPPHPFKNDATCLDLLFDATFWSHNNNWYAYTHHRRKWIARGLNKMAFTFYGSLNRSRLCMHAFCCASETKHLDKGYEGVMILVYRFANKFIQ